MNKELEQVVIEATESKEIIDLTVIQDLWSGYGQILRVSLAGGALTNVVVKYIQIPQNQSHPRGWNSQTSQERKIRSYQVELNWYDKYSQYCKSDCIVPQSLYSAPIEGGSILILEDLKYIGYPIIQKDIDWTGVQTCIRWLANFHAKFLGHKAEGLWQEGTYWHLATRPEELQALKAGPLKDSASLIANKLSASPFQTLVHGDAKLANFCFSEDCLKVAAVDFQYVGAGCGMKDLAYFVGSCIDDNDCETLENDILDLYFSTLKAAVDDSDLKLSSKDLESDWRYLYDFAWADFQRFLRGWSPDHWKINSYSDRKIQNAIEKLG